MQVFNTAFSAIHLGSKNVKALQNFPESELIKELPVKCFRIVTATRGTASPSRLGVVAHWQCRARHVFDVADLSLQLSPFGEPASQPCSPS